MAMESLAHSLSDDSSSREIAVEIARFLDSKRAEDVKILDVSELLQITSFFVLATGSSKRALRALADESDRLLKLTSLSKIGVESDQEGRWVCLDYSDVVMHFFDRDARAFYDLDHLWGDAPRVEFE